MDRKKFYITTPIYYTNSSPHIGAAYTTVAADVLARWHKVLGEDVFFLTGTDEHGQKVQEIAEQNGKLPKDFVDNIVHEFKESFKILDIKNDHFVRTTDEYHIEEVRTLLSELYKNGLIYKDFYESYYCVGCEQYLTSSDLVDGKCPLHNRIPELKKEEAYLFKLSSFQERLSNLIRSGEYCILPEIRRKEILTFIEGGLQDVSISRLREKISWGIELPFDDKHTAWVWPDAFWNYVSGLRFCGDDKFQKFWSPDVQLMAKDILRVHATIWPALLMGAEYTLPKKLFIHGYFTIDGKKMSKSLGNVISPITLVNKYGSDSVRYNLMRNISFGQDGDFSESSFIDRHNNELANKWGNLVARTTGLIERYGLAESVNSLKTKFNIDKIKILFDNFEIDKVLNEVFLFIDICNEYLQIKKPWETKDNSILYEVADSIRLICIVLWPFLPTSCEKISEDFGFNVGVDSFKLFENKITFKDIKKGEILFKKID
jgi:methionyl-tRNA synthetase